jgi:hypothetical protein
LTSDLNRGSFGARSLVPFILNANAQVMCSHGGTFKFIPSNPTVMVGGAPVLTIADVAVPATPCPFATPAGPAPCTQLAPPLGGFALKVVVNGTPVLLDTTQWMTIPTGAGVPVPATVVFAGQTAVQGS